jgi:hypothetical protein
MAHPHETEILQRLETGESLLSICKTEGFPHESTVRTWARDDEDFFTKYARARDLGLDAMADQVQEIASGALDKDDVPRARLEFDAKRWYLSKLAPKRYGDSITNKLADPDGNALKIVVTGIRPTDKNT